jgi:hypothetical protein
MLRTFAYASPAFARRGVGPPNGDERGSDSPGRAMAFRESDRADRRRADDAYGDETQLRGIVVLADDEQTRRFRTRSATATCGRNDPAAPVQLMGPNA